MLRGRRRKINEEHSHFSSPQNWESCASLSPRVLDSILVLLGRVLGLVLIRYGDHAINTIIALLAWRPLDIHPKRLRSN